MNPNMYTVLQTHAVLYPLLQPCDAVKLIYQSIFGPGHMIPSEAAAWERLEAEYSTVSHTGEFRMEFLGNTARVYMDTPLTKEKRSLLARLFCESAKNFCKGWDDADETTKEMFVEALRCLRQAAAGGMFNFTVEELDVYLAAYRTAGYPAVSHSEIYRKAYSPAYRVIDSRFARIFDLLADIHERMKNGKRLVVAVDGRCASGKTTIGEYISRVFPVSVIHMDDFFLPGEYRTPERMRETGGNLHRERFISEVIPNLRGGSFTHRVFQCSTFTYADVPRVVEDNPIIICEGSYSLHPAFGEYYDIAVFSDIEPAEQLRRIRERNGEVMLTRFQNEWIPMEEKYFTEMQIREKCEYILG